MKTSAISNLIGFSPPPHQGNIPVPDITKAFDAIFYVDEMTPASRIGAR